MGLVMVPIAFLLGGAIDYQRAVTSRLNLKHDIDEAALAAAKHMRGCTPAGSRNCQNAATKAGVGAAQSYLLDKRLPVTDLKTTTKLAYDAATAIWTATVNFTAKSPTTLLKMIRLTAIDIGDQSSAAISFGVPFYTNFYLLLDNSSSMGIAASNADMDRMRALTPKWKAPPRYDDVPDCVFACHQPGFSSVYYDVPKANGVRFRIDDLRDATLGLLETAKTVAAENTLDKLKFGVYAFNNSVSTLSAPTGDLSLVSSLVTSLDLPTAADDGTQIENSISWLTNKVVKGKGDGKSDTTPFEIAFIVTDGVEDGANTGWRSKNYPTGFSPAGTIDRWLATPDISGAISETACDGLKKKGVTVAVVYTTYLPFPGTWRYDNMVKPFEDKIQPRLEACATKDYFYVASAPGEIEKGMKLLFDKAVRAMQLRVTK
jgi:hypothetical protein